jgi:uncharacterized protein YndB with AHSA1/START domain
MATAPSLAPSLRIKRVFQAPRAKVFAAWTDKEQVAQWRLKSSPEFTTKLLECDAREGGHLVMEVRLPNGWYQVNRSTYKTVRPPEKLVFTYEWEQFDPSGKKTGELTGTVVTVDFYERGDATEVVLVHEFFPNESQRDSHNGGWNAVLDLLERLLAA